MNAVRVAHTTSPGTERCYPRLSGGDFESVCNVRRLANAYWHDWIEVIQSLTSFKPG